eukprot:c8900_g1_i2.p1 GENE.c8900_g1_i2~~c8900_g1_i2.p1  ORF type:complete len:355 (+),score=79.31 c8900_g1_i2:286-1350(+)
MKDCGDDDCAGNGMVLRISLAMVLVASILAVLLFGVSSGSQPRAAIQNSFFSIKWVLLAGIAVATVWMDNKSLMAYAYTSAVLSSLFMVAGIVLMLEWAHTWNDTWVSYLDQSDSKFWGVAIIGTSLFIFSGSIVVWALLIHYYGGDHCTHTNAFVSVTIVLSVIVTITSVFDKVKNGALLPSAVMVAYATYLLASAVINIPSDNSSECVARHSRIDKATQKGIYSVGVIFTIVCVGYCTIRRASYGESLKPSERKTVSAADRNDAEGGEVIEDEEDHTEYNYSFFHVVYVVGAMYLSMVLINWDLSLQLKDDQLGSKSTWTAVWVKMGSQWAAFAIYFWSLIAPLVCSGRDFD